MTTATEDKAHADLGASNSSIWLNCLHAGRHARSAPKTTSKFAAEGTVAHTMSELILVFGEDMVRAHHVGKTITVDGHAIEVTDEMLDHVMVYVDEVQKLQAQNNADLSIEEKLSLNDLYAIHKVFPHEPLFGTGDAVLVGPSILPGKFFIRVVDLKYGAGVPVEADTSQGKYYGLGAMLKILNDKGIGNLDLITGIEVTIVQPRAPHKDGPIRRAIYTTKDLWDFGRQIMVAVSAIQDPNIKALPLKAGKWCTFCPLAGTCPEQLRVNMALAKGDFAMRPVPQVHPKSIETYVSTGARPMIDPDRLANAELAFVLDRKDEFKRWIDSIEQEAVKRLELQGDSVPGWKLVAKRSSRQWNVPDNFLETYLGSCLSGYEDKIFPRERVSPAQAEKLLPKAIYKALEDVGYIKKVPGEGVTLAPAKDARPAIDRHDQAKQEFG